MSEETTIESIDTSETESEEWDLIQNKDVQVSENTSDAESIEIINEEVVQAINSEFLDNDNSESLNHDLSESVDEKYESPLTDISSTLTNSSYIESNLYLGCSSTSERNTLSSEPREAFYICSAVFLLGLAVLINPEGDSIFSNSSHPVGNENDIELASLIKELQMYRETNENLRQQVKDLYEVVNGLRKFALDQPIADHIHILKPKTTEEPSEKAFYPPDNISDSLNEIIKFYKEITNISINALNETNRSMSIDELFKNTPIEKEFLSKLHNGSIQRTLELFFKIPQQMKELTMVVSQNNGVKPFISKWGNKFIKFSKYIDSDVKRLKLKFAKHFLKNINGMMNSFYNKLCRFEINEVITFQDCDSFNFTKTKSDKKKNNGENKSKLYEEQLPDKLRKSQKYRDYKKNLKINKHFMKSETHQKTMKFNDQDDKITPNENRKIGVEAEIAGNIEINNEDFGQTASYVKDNNEDTDEFIERQKRIITIINQINQNKNDKNKNNGEPDFEYLKKYAYELDSCGEGSLRRCNATYNPDTNWFLNIGDHRSRIRSHQSKGDWLFERAKARRNNKMHVNQRHFNQKQTNEGRFSQKESNEDHFRKKQTDQRNFNEKHTNQEYSEKHSNQGYFNQRHSYQRRYTPFKNNWFQSLKKNLLRPFLDHYF